MVLAIAWAAASAVSRGHEISAVRSRLASAPPGGTGLPVRLVLPARRLLSLSLDGMSLRARASSTLRRLDGDSALSPDGRAIFARERTQYNLRILRWLMPIAAIAHAVIAAFLAARTPPQGYAVFARNVIAIDGAMIAVATFLALVAWSGERSRLARLHPIARDLVVAAYVTMGALVSANAQIVQSTPQMFLICSLSSALLRPRPRVQVAAIAIGLAIVLAGVFLLQNDAQARIFNPPTAVVFSAVAVGAFLTIDRSRVRELVSRSALARLNAELEQRVQDQVHVIVDRAAQIDRLNVQLAEKVRERSRELSIALARLAGVGGKAPNATIPPGTVLGDRVVVESTIGAGGMGTVYRGF